ncbi:PKD domain-containing protein [Myxococcota bacterium]
MRLILLTVVLQVVLALANVAEVIACTVGCATGQATFDGRPMATRNLDFGPTTGIRGMHIHEEGPYRYLHLTTANPSSGVCWPINDVLNIKGLYAGANYSNTLFAIYGERSSPWPLGWDSLFSNIDEMSEVRSHIDAITVNVSRNHNFISGEGKASMFEVGEDSHWEYDVEHPTRQNSDFPYGTGANFFAVRSSQSFMSDDHSETGQNGPSTFVNARTLYSQYINDADAFTPWDGIAVARYGDPWTDMGDAHPISVPRSYSTDWQTRAATVVLGVNQLENGKYATMLAAFGQPDYGIFIPAWAALDNSDISEHCAHDPVRPNTIEYWPNQFKEVVPSVSDKTSYDEYINDLYAGLQDNIINAVIEARTKWFASGDQADFHNTIKDMHQRSAWSAYHAIKSAYNTRGNGRQCNDIPVITSMTVTPDGSNSINCSATATDDDGIKEYSWKFGDGSANVTGASQTHTYSAPGTYMVSVIAKDDHTHMTANVMFKWVTVAAACTPDCVGKDCGDDGCGGSCGPCTDPFVCASGSCECPAGLAQCGGNCVDLQASNDHCGECDNACDTGAVCTLGTCSLTCGDTTCDSDENCENCPSDCPTSTDEVCCSGVLHAGDCCDNQDCTDPDTCVGWLCLPPSTCETDADGDHYGVGASCAGPDCDDTDPVVHPGAAERCDDEIDNDCDGVVNEDCTSTGGGGDGVIIGVGCKAIPNRTTALLSLCVLGLLNRRRKRFS